MCVREKEQIVEVNWAEEEEGLSDLKREERGAAKERSMLQLAVVMGD